MLMASKQWPSGGYASVATMLINAVMSTDMSGSYIKAGSNYSATGITNPSYFAPAFYRVFGWTALADNSYTLLNASLQGRTNGLVPAWCTGGSCNAPASNGAATDTIYQYDSHRVPWRIGLDYCWNGTAAAKTYLDKISGFFSGKAAMGVGRVFDIYNLTGMETSDAAVNSGSAIGTAGLRRDGEHPDGLPERRLPAGARPPEPRRRSAIAWRRRWTSRAGTPTSTPPSAC
jgi:endo-1,4-beta-D-glucanase Y